jgi:hypothetical protein
MPFPPTPMRTQFGIVRRSEAASAIARMNSGNISGMGGWGCYEGYPPPIGAVVQFPDASGGPVVAEVICVHWVCEELDNDDTKFIETPEARALVATMHGPYCVALCAYISGDRSDLKEP